MVATATSARDIEFLDLIARAESAYRGIPKISLRGVFEQGMYSSSEDERRTLIFEAADEARENDRAISEVINGFAMELEALFFGVETEDMDPGFQSMVKDTLELALSGKDQDDFVSIARDYAQFAEFAKTAYSRGWADRGQY